MKTSAALALFVMGGIALAQQTRGLSPVVQADPGAVLKTGKAYALIIGTNDYSDPSWPHLQNPAHDAQTISDELKTNFGYQPVLLISPTKLDVEKQLRAFLDRKYDPADSVFIFVAGHGKFDDELQQGYLVFRDSKHDDPLNSSYMAHLDLRQYVDRIPATRILLVIDACFGGTIDDSVAKRAAVEMAYSEASKIERLARKSHLTTRLYLTSGGKEYVADGRPGSNSPFAAQILRALRGYDSTGLVTFDDIWQKAQLVQGQQPVYNWFGRSDTDADFWFATAKASLTAPAAAAPSAGNTRGAAPTSTGDPALQLMQLEYSAIQSSNDLTALKAFVTSYKGKPAGQALVALTESRINTLSTSAFHFDSAHDRDVLPLNYGGKWTLFTRQGKVVATTDYDSVKYFSERVAVVGSNGRFGAIDQKGNVVVPIEFHILGDRREGLMDACPETLKCGYVGPDGKFTIQPVYRRPGIFSDGLAKVQDDAGHAWFINHQGNQVLEATDANAYFTEGTVGAADEKKQWGFKDRSGKWVIQPAYEAVGAFYRGRAPVKSGGKWQFIDTAGIVVAQSDADLIPLRSANDPAAAASGLISARKDGKWGFIDNSGKWILPPSWDAIMLGFVDGVAEAMIGKSPIWIDELGNSILNPDAPKSQVRVSPREGLRYVLIPPGSFTMGCSPGDGLCKDDEKPSHVAQIATGFWLGETEVTQAAWKKIMGGDNPSEFKGDQLPVERVSATQADAYCKAIGGRLPTAKEWEYAARGLTPGKWYNSDLNAIAWFRDNAAQRSTKPVAQKQPNAFGLYDMLGNVWEWTADDYSPGHREMRGGAWGNIPQGVRVSTRQTDPLVNSIGIFNTGFRCVANLK